MRLRGPRARAAAQAQRRALAAADARRLPAARVEAVAWEEAEELYALAAPGHAVYVAGVFEMSERWGAKIKLSGLREAAPDEYDADDLAVESEVSFERLESRPARAARRRSRAPAALTCSTASSARTRRPGRASATRRRPRSTTRPTATGCSSTRSPSPRRSAPPPPSSPASTATSPSPAPCCTTSARPRPTTRTRWRSTSPTPAASRARSRSAITWCAAQIEEIPGFDPALAQAVLHIILSHHGSLEHGSPVVPATREAVLVHMIDNLGGRLGSFDRLERELPAGESWSGFDRALSGSAYFGPARRLSGQRDVLRMRDVRPCRAASCHVSVRPLDAARPASVGVAVRAVWCAWRKERCDLRAGPGE